MKFKIFTLLLLSLAIFTGCEKNGSGKNPPSRIVFGYLSMDHNLGYYGKTNVDDMAAAATKANIGDDKIVVYVDKHQYDGSMPRIIEISAGSGGQGQQVVLKEYTENLNSADPAVLKAVMRDMKALAGTAPSYGFLMGSHGTGWLPEAGKDAVIGRAASEGISISPSSVLQDGQYASARYMEIDEFAQVMEEVGLKFDFMVFDLCYMAGIEIAYPLRNITDYIVASVTEVPSVGMPYREMVPLIFAAEPKLGANGLAQACYDDNVSRESYATFSLIDCTKIDAEFVSLTKSIIADKFDGMRALGINDVQPYDRLAVFDLRNMYDMGDIMTVLYSADLSNQKYLDFKEALDEIVPYKATTSRLLNGVNVSTTKYSGMTMYIPFDLATYDNYNTNYMKTAWYKAVYDQSEHVLVD